METITILLADDHSLMCEGTRHILEQYPGYVVVAQAGEGEEALELARKLQPDVAILDIRLPKLNGVEVVRKMKEHAPATKALMLTAYDDDDCILAAMEAGASGYLLKTARATELADAVLRVRHGESVLDPAIVAKVARLWSGLASRNRHDPAHSLSSREHDVLELAAGGLRNRDIAERLSISIRTVEGHFNSIFAKLNVSSRLEAALYAVSSGIVVPPEKDKA